MEALFADNNSKTSLEQLPKLNYVYEQVWDLDAADDIGFGLRLDGPTDTVKKHEQLTISYGARSNSFLLVRYGFAVPRNPFDFVRRSNITIQTFIEEPIADPALKTLFDAKLAELGMKDTLQADLKASGVHRDVLALIRCYEEAAAEAAGQEVELFSIETKVVKRYLKWLGKEKDRYQTRYFADKKKLKAVLAEMADGKYHWMYPHVLTYRIGQKEILELQSQYAMTLVMILMSCQGSKATFSRRAYAAFNSNSLRNYLEEDLGISAEDGFVEESAVAQE